MYFHILRGRILEIGIGTGPNLRYYHSKSIVEVIGLDPDRNIENRARSSATSAGFPPSKFKFIHGVGEAIPLSDASVDAVVGTLVLCSVKDVDVTLKEIKRVLRPGGLYVFVEHVGAKDRKMLRIVQTILNPVSKKFCGWCHLNRDIGGNICRAGFSSVEQNMAYVTSSELRNPLENPIVYGMAYK
ncbi:methyltransferase-like protein 7A [Senna tora]|uniref:Methyltransferase-like protein 7A n=1 Tax=Senna tora TaxID=362788 RepID=A0A834W9N4_9FABA|nr:methyltransferase-like protein 7A [Senna tora]